LSLRAVAAVSANAVAVARKFRRSLLAEPEGGLRGLDERHIEMQSALVFDFVLIDSHGADIDDRIVVLAVEIAAEPIGDHRRFGAEIRVEELLSAGYFCEVDLNLSVRCGSRQKRQQPGQRHQPRSHDQSPHRGDCYDAPAFAV
jgi:hypothetical protein